MITEQTVSEKLWIRWYKGAFTMKGLQEKVAYLQGLAEGMALGESKEAKLKDNNCCK